MSAPSNASNVPKKSQEIGEHEYKIGDIVLAKVRGYPQWPGQLVDPESVPEAVARERPPSKKTKFYAVRFFPAGDYTWSLAKDLSLLQKHEIEAYINEPHKKSADLLKAYQIALDPSTWEASLSAPGISTADGDEEVEEEIDELDEPGDDGDSDKGAAKAGRKRKRDSEAKPRKKKEASAKGSAGEGKEKKTPSKKKLSKKNGTRSKETVESEDDGDEADAVADGNAETDPSKKPTPPKKAKKEKPDAEDDPASKDPDNIKAKEWRHMLQRGFLSKTTPKEEEMPEYDQLFTTIENYDLTINQLSYSKLGKVMRHITQLDPSKLQQEDKYQIRKRADALLDKWQKFVHNAEEGRGSTAKATTSPEAINGSVSKPPEGKIEVASNKPISTSEKVPITNPAPDANVNGAEASIPTGETTGLAVDTPTSTHAPNVPTTDNREVAAADDEQAMDMTD